MAKYRVLVTDKLSDKGVDVFKADKDIEVDVKATQDEAALKEDIKNYDAIVIRSATTMTAAIIEGADRLKVIGRAGVGLDNVDIPAATRKGIAVMNTPDGNTISAAEHTIALILSLARNVAPAHQSLREKKWDRAKYSGIELYGKTLGLIGTGRIGGEVAKRMKAFSMEIIALDPFCTPKRAEELGVELVSKLDDILQRSDFITVHVPKTAETTNMLNKQTLAKCKKGVRVINVARGGIINEADLAEALASGQVGGAGIDVFSEEPPTGNPLLDAENIVLTPHLGASTTEAQVNVAAVVAQQIVDALHGRTIANAVNIPALSKEAWKEIQPYYGLCQQLAAFAGQFAAQGLKKVNITFAGGAAEQEVEALQRVLLVGLLKPALDDAINLINAPLLAKDKGVEVSSTKKENAGAFANLISLELDASDGKHLISGSLMGPGDARVVDIDGYKVDLRTEGISLLFFNKDQPGVVGKVGTLLGDAGINISGLSNGRKEKGGEALSVVAVDSEVSTAVLESLGALEGIRGARLVKF